MKKVMTLAFAGLLAGSMAFAGAEKLDSEKEKSFTNPLTGTKHTTKKSKNKAVDSHGNGHDVTVTEKTAEKTDGSKTKSVDVDADSASGK